jgi:Ca2+-binding RTX toxin-like protein
LFGTNYGDNFYVSTLVNWYFVNTGDGDDYVTGISDIFDGGTGYDTVNYSTYNFENAGSSGFTVDLPNSIVSGSVRSGRIQGVENVIASNFNDIVTGTLGRNSLSGLNGNDTLEGLGDADTLYGGGGRDLLSYYSSSGGVTLDLRASSVSGGDGQGDIIGDFEDVNGSGQNDQFIGSDLDNSLIGNGGNDVLFGLFGRDVLEGGEGADSLYGQDDNDTIAGGNGNDVVVGGRGADRLDGGNGDGYDIVAFSQTWGGNTDGYIIFNLTTQQVQAFDTDPNNPDVAGDVAFDVLSGFEGAVGTRGNDQLIGDSGNNFLQGDAGNDTLWGNDGNDTLEGGNGSDWASYSGSARVTASLLTGQALYTNNYDTLLSIENLLGGDNNDTLTGSNVANTLAGGLGDDFLTGGSGADTFAYLERTWDNDIIADFAQNIDRISLIGLGFNFQNLTVTAGAGGAVVSFAGITSTITLNNTAVNAVDASDFFF